MYSVKINYCFMGQCAYVEVWDRVTHELSQLSFTIHDIKLRRKTANSAKGLAKIISEERILYKERFAHATARADDTLATS